MQPPRERLESWKEIAAYLKRDVRTVQRWEKTAGLPVHRIGGKSSASVYAFPQEIDAWLDRRPERSLTPEWEPATTTPEVGARRSVRIWVAIAAIFVVVVAAVIYATRRSAGVVHRTVLVAALDNRTGASLPEDVVPYLLERDLSNSGVEVVTRARVDDDLALMRKDRATKLTEAVAREISLRDPGIQAILTSRVERIGQKYLLTASLLDASDGRLLGGASDTAASLESLPEVVSRICGALARHLTNRPSESRRTEMVEPVTTASLRAYQFFSAAYLAALREEGEPWEQFSRRALAEDPQFAYAHIFLAWRLWNSGKPERDWKAQLDEAVAQSGTASDRERRFILASALHMTGKYQEAIAAYREMLSLYPNEFWARNNLRSVLEQLGKQEEAASESYRLADLRPTNPRAQYNAMSVAISMHDIPRAHTFAARARPLIDANPEAFPDYERSQVANFGLHELWVKGRLEELKRELDRLTAAGAPAEGPHAAWSFYLALGRLKDARSLLPRMSDLYRNSGTSGVEFFSDNAAAFHNWRELDCNEQKGYAPRCTAVVYPGMSDSQRRVLDQFLSQPPTPQTPAWLQEDFRSRVAAMRDYRKAADDYWKLPRTLNPISLGHYDMAVFIAEAAGRAGDDGFAYDLLTKADVGSHEPLYAFGASLGPPWHRLRYERARFARKLGETAEAREIESGLFRDLRLADPDHPILVRLREPGRRPFDVF